ncbi:MAG: cbb3-type cytochrome c oxidase subunit I [Ardenticatenia bacterium]|nr:cbb3-type cytochrome c oxidase subunit I [Ardenticatenia bacterium]
MHAQQFRPHDRFVLWQLYIALAAVFLGVIMGFFQALERMNIDLFKVFGFASYYQGLTLHGVLNVLVFTTAFIGAFLTYVTMRSLGRPMASYRLTALQFVLMMLGVVLAGWKMLDNSSTVLFTFYPPLQAHPLFYVGLVFVVLSSWVTFLNIALTVRAWQRDHPGETVPLQAFLSLVVYLMWFIASLGVASEVLVLLIPWSLGWVERTDPQLARTLFWFTGHAIVYFWLLPAYISWYTMLPKQVGSKLLSDPLTRLVFLMFLLFSVPVGFHHQFVDPGVPVMWKTIHAALTYAVFFPSMITFFSVIASLEMAGRARGGQGLFGWILKLPWNDPSVTAQLLAGIGFMFGGISGLINASYNLNQVVHNTSFVPGHFHLTVGTGVFLSYLGISYWLIPALTGRKLWQPRLGVVSSWLWLIGVSIFSRGQIAGGLEGMPRRTWMAAATYVLDAWRIPNMMTAVGGTLMFLGAMSFFTVLLGTLFLSRERVTVTMPVADIITPPEAASPIFTRQLGLWVAVLVVLIMITYGPYMISYFSNPAFVARGLRVW